MNIDQAKQNAGNWNGENLTEITRDLMTWHTVAFPHVGVTPIRTLKHLATEIVELTESIAAGEAHHVALDRPGAAFAWISSSGHVWEEWAGAMLMLWCLGARLGIDVQAALEEHFRILQSLDFAPGPDGISRHSGKTSW